MKFDEAFDVAVAGYGFASAVPAIESAKDGARLLSDMDTTPKNSAPRSAG